MARDYTLSAGSVRKLARTNRRVEKQPVNLRQHFPSGPNHSDIQAPEEIVYAINDDDEDAPGYAVMAVTGCKLMADENGTLWKVFTVTKPDTTFRRQYVVNGNLKLVAGGMHRIPVGPYAKVLYDSGTPANGEGWGPKPGQWSLAKNYPQTALCAGVVDSDNKIMLASWGPIVSGMGQATEAITAGASGTIAVLQGTLPGTIISHSAVDMEIDCVCPMELAEDDYCVFGYYNGQLAAFPWDCGE